MISPSLDLLRNHDSSCSCSRFGKYQNYDANYYFNFNLIFLAKKIFTEIFSLYLRKTERKSYYYLKKKNQAHDENSQNIFHGKLKLN